VDLPRDSCCLVVAQARQMPSSSGKASQSSRDCHLMTLRRVFSGRARRRSDWRPIAQSRLVSQRLERPHRVLCGVSYSGASTYGVMTLGMQKTLGTIWRQVKFTFRPLYPLDKMLGGLQIRCVL
jgi:hypothetical protein